MSSASLIDTFPYEFAFWKTVDLFFGALIATAGASFWAGKRLRSFGHPSLWLRSWPQPAPQWLCFFQRASSWQNGPEEGQACYDKRIRTKAYR